MDNFLSKIYHEERTKTAGAELDRYLEDLPADVLLKIAVAGTPHPELPTSLPDGEFKRMMDAVAEHVNKEHLSAIPTRKDSSSVSSISFQGEGKQPVENQDEALRHSKTAGLKWDTLKNIARSAATDVVGLGAIGAGVGAITGEDGDRVRSALKGALVGGGMGVGRNIGSDVGYLATKGGRAINRMSYNHPDTWRRVYGTPAYKKAKKVIQLATRGGAVAGGAAGGVAGGIAGAKLAPKKKESGLTKECSVSAVEKAKIAMRAFSVARSAPANVKLAAASLAGKQLAKLAEETPPVEYSVRPESWWAGQKGITRAGRRPGSAIFADNELIGERTVQGVKNGLMGIGLGVLSGAAVGALIDGKPGAGVGALLGGALGGAVGQASGQARADKAYFAKKGIETTGFLGAGRGRFTPEAAEKYLKD